jgi:hypothetical protein
MKNRFLPLIIFLILAAVLVFTVDNFIHRVIVGPFLYVAWFVTLFITSLPQQVFWGVFIIAALVIATKSMVREKTVRQQTGRVLANNSGPVATWFSLLERANKQEFSRWRLAQALKKLTWDTLLADEPINDQLLKDRQEDAQLALPPEIKAYFGAPLPSSQRFARLFHRRWTNPRLAALDLDPETVAEYLENQLYPIIGE